MVFHLNSYIIQFLYHKKGCNSCLGVAYSNFTSYRFVAYCLRNCNEWREAAKCLDCHHDDGILSELLLNPILVSWFWLLQLLCSCLLQFHYHFVAYCLMTFKLLTVVVKAPSAANDTVASGEDNHSQPVDCFWYIQGLYHRWDWFGICSLRLSGLPRFSCNDSQWLGLRRPHLLWTTILHFQLIVLI